jgi:hypothetical protein
VHALTQVGADPRLVSGLEDLLDEQGCEVYIKRPDRYGLKPLQRFTWSQVRASACGDARARARTFDLLARGTAGRSSGVPNPLGMGLCGWGAALLGVENVAASASLAASVHAPTR